jgi:hypothetical protein
MLKTSITLALFAGVATLASAQLRAIPLDAKRGTIQHVQEMMVAIDGVQTRLAPGAQIRDASNRLVLPVALPGAVPVKYLLDAEGMVRQVWILTPQEAAAADKVN